MKVMLIDPWGINNTSEYLNGLISGFSGIVELSVFTNAYFVQYVKADAQVHKVFFSKSEKMRAGTTRTILRGLEYLNGYRKIIRELQNNHYDVVHINWLLNYKLDIHFLKIIKQHVGKIVYTAHNALPHVNGEKYKELLQVIYSLSDRIIVHGEAVKKELIGLYPDTIDKIYIQRHGCIAQSPTPVNEALIPADLKAFVERFEKVFISCGAVFPNKGIDRLIKIWIDEYSGEKACLIAGGRQTASYPEYDELKPRIRQSDNIFLLDGFIDENVMAYLFTNCTMVILPYRHASMSGIVFSAAQYKKPIICTNVGALSEYLEPGTDSIVCENDDSELKNSLKKALTMDVKSLMIMGEKLSTNIQQKCNWDNICTGVFRDVYSTKKRSKR